ncbi:MAG TPA: hypothetical protein VLW85_04300 [Myxococcales bacterium]|nr:hypothetical protein [Myxococcales bacterium]
MRAAALALLLAAAPALAAPEGLTPVSRPARWGFGVLLGDPFGLSLKRYMGGAQAWDAYAAFAYGPGIRFGADWIWILGRAVQARQVDLDVYVGAGPFIGSFRGPCGVAYLNYACNGDVYFGGRVPIGAELLFKEAPVSVGAELAPALLFAPGGALLYLDFLLAIRVLF